MIAGVARRKTSVLGPRPTEPIATMGREEWEGRKLFHWERVLKQKMMLRDFLGQSQTSELKLVEVE